ncbi:unnamed protein product [Medioppia subpectinata]|uniref:G-protein coupled receptors family 1 profile domain-containing protein n=1 Tax=Medioppia subpectinata TaxID=1979941 RepID=A0A7R9L316_9ACAR|nr:unnamed protein product [Medioppia subpectinata]CAG2114364.1 unnamed protein product [Medioppia subpectinata]
MSGNPLNQLNRLTHLDLRVGVNIFDPFFADISAKYPSLQYLALNRVNITHIAVEEMLKLTDIRAIRLIGSVTSKYHKQAIPKPLRDASAVECLPAHELLWNDPSTQESYEATIELVGHNQHNCPKNGFVSNTKRKTVKGSPNLQSHSTTKFVVNLAITDLLFCSLNMPLASVRYMTRSWPFGTILCQWYPFFFYGNVATSLMSITCITVNRLVFIAFHSYYTKIYRKMNVWLMIWFCWIFSFGLTSMPLLGMWGRFGYRESTFSCTILADSYGNSPKKFLFAFGFVIPITVIIICYTIIWIHVRRQSSLTVKTAKRDLRLTKLIFAIFGAFLVCFAPITVTNVLITETEYPYLHPKNMTKYMGLDVKQFALKASVQKTCPIVGLLFDLKKHNLTSSSIVDSLSDLSSQKSGIRPKPLQLKV